MKKNEVKVGHVYVAKVSGQLAPVRIDSVHSRGGWNATNTKTGKRVHIRSAQRLRHEVRDGNTPGEAKADQPPAASDKAGKADKPAKDTAAKKATKSSSKDTAEPKRMSALDAAAEVLRKAGEPMNARAMIAAMAEQGLWQSPGGKTPHATLYAAILREIANKGTAARFRKVDRGRFEFAGKEATHA